LSIPFKQSRGGFVPTLKLLRLHLPKAPLRSSINELDEAAKPKSKRREREIYSDLLGITGVAVTLTVLLSGMYVFFRDIF
jgi:hypothetical protein